MRGTVLELCELYDDLMQNICDLCHHPFQAIDDEQLDDMFCSRCKVAKVIDCLKESEFS